MNDFYTIEAKKTCTGCMLAQDVKDEPVRFSPVRVYDRYEDQWRGGYKTGQMEMRTVRQILSYDGDDRVWFDTYEQAKEVIYRHQEGAWEFEDSGTPCYWDYQSGQWRQDNSR